MKTYIKVQLVKAINSVAFAYFESIMVTSPCKIDLKFIISSSAI